MIFDKNLGTINEVLLDCKSRASGVKIKILGVVSLEEKRFRETAGGFNHHAPYDIQRKVELDRGVE